ncbi:hypothetical protein ACIBI7_35810 [Nonomuraea fuscirosea]|uniref:hypothetical protein n=1 Tax=Nonomuraea fuscirosea TaxID=1291556 RepID=UPI00378E36A9
MPTVIAPGHPNLFILLPAEDWAKFLSRLMPPPGFDSVVEKRVRQEFDALLGVLGVDPEQFRFLLCEAVERGEPFGTIRPFAYEAHVTRDQVLAPSRSLTHAQMVELIRFFAFAVVLLLLLQFTLEHMDQVAAISLVTGWAVLPVAKACARKIAEEYDKRFGPGDDD